MNKIKKYTLKNKGFWGWLVVSNIIVTFIEPSLLYTLLSISVLIILSFLFANKT